MDDDQLEQALASELRATTEHFIRLASIVRVLEDRGRDLSNIRLGMMTYIRKIAYGQVVPDLVAQYQDKPLVLDRLAQLPPPEQARIASGGTVKVMVVEGSGTTFRMVSPRDMSADEIRQVFDRGRIRTEAEQVSLIRSRPTFQQVRIPVGVKLDLRRKGIIVSGDDLFIPLKQLSEIVAQLLSSKRAG